MNLYNKTKDISNIINLSLKTLNGANSRKIAFKNTEINENFYLNENLYAVVFDIDKSPMINQNDPIQALNLLGDSVLGVFSCMSDNDSKYVISGIEDENGLVLRTYLVAYVYAKYEEIKETLCDFIDELEFLPLDIEMLLSVSFGKSGNEIDSLKELANMTKGLNIASISQEVDIAIESVEVDTLQYAQLQRFLDIAGLIDESDVSKLTDFFNNIYKGEVYIAKTQEVIVDDALKGTLNGILSQQKNALVKVQTDNDMQRIVSMIESLRKYFPNMPKDISSKKLVSEFINTQLVLEGITKSITYEGNVATLVSIINEDEIISFRDFLQKKAGEEIHINFIDCQEIHFAIIQLIMAYKKNYNVTYEFAKPKKLFQIFLEGFDSNYNSCKE